MVDCKHCKAKNVGMECKQCGGCEMCCIHNNVPQVYEIGRKSND
jgi:hypothetical protein